MKKYELEQEVNQLVESQKSAMLSTYAEAESDDKAAGFPFGSVVRYVTGQSDEFKGQPILMLSRIAEHSKHIENNNHVSLLISAEENDAGIQQTARITLLGCMIKLDSEDPALQQEAELYFQSFPETRDYFQLLDFDFYYLHVEKRRYVAGFGRAHWLKN